MEIIRLVAQLMGDFKSIEATSKFMLAMSEVLNEREFLPGTTPGFSLSNQKSILLPKFHTSDNEWVINFAPDRIFIERLKTNEELNINDFEEFKSTATELFDGICGVIECKVNRLAFNMEFFIRDVNTEQLDKISKKLCPDIEFFNAKPLPEWNYRMVTKEDMTILEKPEVVNFITLVSRVSGMINTGEGARFFEGFKVDLDINTIAENTDNRFDRSSIAGYLTSIKDKYEQLASELEEFLCQA